MVPNLTLEHVYRQNGKVSLEVHTGYAEGSVTLPHASIPPLSDTVSQLLIDAAVDLSAVSWLLGAGLWLILRNTENN